MLFMWQIHITCLEDKLNGGEKVQPCVVLNVDFVGKRETKEEL